LDKFRILQLHLFWDGGSTRLPRLFSSFLLPPSLASLLCCSPNPNPTRLPFLPIFPSVFHKALSLSPNLFPGSLPLSSSPLVGFARSTESDRRARTSRAEPEAAATTRARGVPSRSVLDQRDAFPLVPRRIAFEPSIGDYDRRQCHCSMLREDAPACAAPSVPPSFLPGSSASAARSSWSEPPEPGQGLPGRSCLLTRSVGTPHADRRAAVNRYRSAACIARGATRQLLRVSFPP
jgi:hypothetical protein